MKKKKVMSIFGTRPEAIKMIPIIKELDKNDNINNIVCVTAQHRDMLDQVLRIFDIVPNYDLDIMKSKQTLSEITIRILEKLDLIIKKEKPDLILVHGDTTTTFVSSLSAFYNKIKIGHVEAGLRTDNKYEPYPEEMNRVLTASIVEYHFAPTNKAKNNLINEGIKENMIYVTGNTIIDLLQYTVDNKYCFDNDILKSIDFTKKVILVTAHRRENIGESLKNICLALKDIAKNNSDVIIIYAVHKNPIVREIVYKYLKGVKNVYLSEPLDLMDMHNLIDRSYMVMTDSGGIQEEASALGKPVLVLRNVTERVEGVESGVLMIVGTQRENIIKQANNLLTNNNQYEKMSKVVNVFGNGTAAKQIVDIILGDV